ncbi:Retrotransposon gag protein [Rhizoctonia solani]|uniref:Retrotransposon gag protein n=1 Tax=Rhizoctonia solani TaxID=456999 RepID=A0A8H7M1D3_9AGAM|nr:Retrotransposon gag protein [Rhizoctonia solani]
MRRPLVLAQGKSVPTFPPLPPALPHVLPPGHPPTLASPTPHIPWQPAPGRPLEPAPLSIRESWDPSFRQPPLSLAKSHSSGSSAFSGGSNPKLTALSGPSWNKPKLAKRFKPTSRTSCKRLMLSRMGLPSSNLPGPHTPEEQKPPRSRKPRAAPKAKPVGKAQPFLGGPAPIISTGAPRRDPLSLFNPYPSSSFPLGPAPASQGPPPAPIVTLAQPPAPSTVKVDHPDAFKGKIGLEAKQWLTQMLAWTVDEFKNKFLAAFGDPDATRAAERKITSLTQTGTCAEYITKFRTLQMELDWNDAALRGQFARGLHWEVRKQIATRERQPRTLRELQDASLIIDNALREEHASHPHQGNKSGKSSTTPTGGQVPAIRPPKPAPSLLIPTTSWRKNATAAAQKDFV